MFILSIVVAALLAGHAAATGVHFAAETPTLAAKTLHANEYIYFPQTLQRVTFLVNDTLLMSYQSGADQLHDDGWRGGLLGSTDQGVTWNIVEQPHSPLLVKSCYEPGQATVAFPADKRLKSWGDNTWLMVTDGKIIHLQDPNGLHQEELLLLLYGQFANSSKYTLVAVHTAESPDPSGAAWTYLSDVSHGAPAPCDNPSEHDCNWLSDGSTLMCVWRSDGTASTLCESRSSDRGRTWTPAQPLSGGRRGEEGEESASPIPSAPIGVEPKLGRLNNGLLVVTAGRPGLYLWVAEDPTARRRAGAGGAGSNLTAPLTWQGFNIAAHHNAAVTDPALRYSTDTPGSTETTSYTGMVVTPDRSGDAVVVSYDRLANGWSPAPYPPPPRGGHGVSALFTVRITITKV